MVDAISSATSGMHYAQTSLDVSANDIANVNTPGFVASEAQGAPASPSIVSTGQPTDLAYQIPAMSTAQVSMGANVAVLKTAQEMYASVLQLLPNGKA